MTISKGGRGRAPEGAAPDPMAADDRHQTKPLPLLWQVDSHDLPPAPSRPWYQRPAPAWVDSRSFADDDPQRLRRAPISQTAGAFLALAHDAATSPHREAREAAALLRQWIEHDQGRFSDLATALGLKRSGISLAEADARAEIHATLVDLARRQPWAAMRPSAAAADLRLQYARFVSAVWPRFADRDSAPGGFSDVRQAFWRIRRFGLERAIPNAQTLAAKIAADRLG